MTRWLLGAALAAGCKGEDEPAPRAGPQPAAAAPAAPIAPAVPKKSCRVETLADESKLVHVEHLGIQISLPPLDWVVDCEQPALAAVRMEQFGILVRAERLTKPDVKAAVTQGLDGVIAAWSEGGAFEPGPREVGTGEDGRVKTCVHGPGTLDGGAHHMRACAIGLPADDGTTVVYVSVFVREAAWDPQAADAIMLVHLVDTIATDWKPESG